MPKYRLTHDNHMLFQWTVLNEGKCGCGSRNWGKVEEGIEHTTSDGHTFKVSIYKCHDCGRYRWVHYDNCCFKS